MSSNNHASGNGRNDSDQNERSFKRNRLGTLLSKNFSLSLLIEESTSRNRNQREESFIESHSTPKIPSSELKIIKVIGLGSCGEVRTSSPFFVP